MGTGLGRAGRAARTGDMDDRSDSEKSEEAIERNSGEVETRVVLEVVFGEGSRPCGEVAGGDDGQMEEAVV